MAKMNLEQLRKLREEKKQDLSRREVEGKEIQVIVGMGTCGIAAGAKQTFDAVVAAVKDVGLGDRVIVRQTGCMGLCYVEPTVEVVVPGMPAVIYGKMTQDVVKEFVAKHLVEKKLLDDHIFDRPAADIMKN
jgi:NADP-reducing hydrogenase subunit HndB